MLIEVYWDAGMKDEALAESPNIGDRRESNSYRSLWRRVFELVAAGKTAEAVARIGSSPQDELTPAYLGHLYALADAKDDSLDQLEEAFGERIPNLPIILRRPILDQWRSDPRFVDLMRRMALEP